MTNTSVLGNVIRGFLAVLTGAGAGAILARKPLLMPVEQRHQPYGRMVS